MIKGGVAVAQEKAPPLRSFLLSPSNHLRHRSLCQPASQPSGQEMLCQLIHLTVKDISFEDGKPTSQLAFKDLGKSHVFGGLPRSNMALTGLKWCASGNIMASGTKSSEGRRKYTTIKPSRHKRIPFTYRLPKTIANRTNREITVSDTTNWSKIYCVN